MLKKIYFHQFSFSGKRQNARFLQFWVSFKKPFCHLRGVTLKNGMFSLRTRIFSYFFHHLFLSSELSLMSNFGNVAVSQKHNVHEIIAHFSPILYKKISGHFIISFFMSTGLILMNNLLKYEL